MTTLAKRLSKDPPLLQRYNDVIQQQLERDIIELAPLQPEGKVDYLPHHPVLTPAKSTKVRLVYDASSKARKGLLSLNDCLYRCPVLLPDLCGVLLRLRLKPVVLSADVEKAFLEINLQPTERDVTRFLWYKDMAKPGVIENNLVTYRFQRVPFGIVSSSFLLAATIRHHLANVDTPTAQQIQDGLYVDNLITTVDSADEATAFYKEAKSTFQQCSMNLRDWQSNSQSVMEQIPDKDQLRSTAASILGLKWDSAQDVLPINSPAQSISEPTKRTVLHQVASVYDPLGLCSPTTLQGKRFLRRLWDSGYAWDAPLHTELLPE